MLKKLLSFFKKKEEGHKELILLNIIDGINSYKHRDITKISQLVKFINNNILKYSLLFISLTKKTPDPEELLEYAYGIIETRKIDDQFNKGKLFEIIGERYYHLNKLFYIYYKYKEGVVDHLEEKYRKFHAFFAEESIPKAIKIIKYYMKYFEYKRAVGSKLSMVYTECITLALAVFIFIFGVAYIDNYFFIQGRNIIPWDVYKGSMGTFRSIIFENTYSFFIFSNKANSLGLSFVQKLQALTSNILVWVGLAVVLYMIFNLVYYLLSYYNKLQVFKHNQEKNFQVFLLIKLEQLRRIDKITEYDTLGNVQTYENETYENEGLGDLMIENILELTDYGLMNKRTSEELYKFVDLGLKEGYVSYLESHTFFSDIFKLFWVKVLDMYKKSLRGHARFNLKYLHDEINKRTEIFSELRDRLLGRIARIFSSIVIGLTFFLTILSNSYSMKQFSDISKTIDVYNHQKQNQFNK